MFRLGIYTIQQSCILCLGCGYIPSSSPAYSVQVGELYFIVVVYLLFRLGRLYNLVVLFPIFRLWIYLLVLYPMFRLGNYISGWSCIKCTSRNQFTDHYKEGMRICLWKKGKIILYFIAWKRSLLKINLKPRFLGHIFRIYLMDKSVLMELKKEKIPARLEVQYSINL